MTMSGAVTGLVRGLTRRVLGVSILVKVLGIGGVVALLFGGVVLLEIRLTLTQTLFHMLEDRARSEAGSLAAQLERPVITRDRLTMREMLLRHMERFPDVRYVVVRDRDFRVIAHTFAHGVPRDLAAAQAERGQDPRDVSVYRDGSARIFESRVPILSGCAGSLWVGLSDRDVADARTVVTASLMWALVLASAMGIGLAYLLAHVLTGPLQRLRRVADLIRADDFTARALVETGDEVGHLAASFNRMADRLEAYRQEVSGQNRVRLALIEKLIQAQEEERKNIGLELHDHVGQSLLALLMTVQSTCGQRTMCVPANIQCSDLACKLITLIDEVRRLAWGMRPSILDDYGLDSALGRHVQEVSRSSGLEIDYQYSAPPGATRLPPNLEITLFRIAQEAMANVVRHARALRASLVVLQGASEVNLLVEDDGCGFDLRARRQEDRPTLGLAGMAERATLLGGSCSVDSRLGRGTTVRVQIPLLAQEAPCPSAS